MKSSKAPLYLLFMGMCAQKAAFRLLYHDTRNYKTLHNPDNSIVEGIVLMEKFASFLMSKMLSLKMPQCIFVLKNITKIGMIILAFCCVTHRTYKGILYANLRQLFPCYALFKKKFFVRIQSNTMHQFCGHMLV